MLRLLCTICVHFCESFTSPTIFVHICYSDYIAESKVATRIFATREPKVSNCLELKHRAQLCQNFENIKVLWLLISNQKQKKNTALQNNNKNMIKILPLVFKKVVYVEFLFRYIFAFVIFKFFDIISLISFCFFTSP